MEVDKGLLAEVEKRAKAARCVSIAETLAVNHPFSVERSLKEREVRHDAFGFYTKQGYQQHDNLGWRWQTENYSPEDCVLVTKVLQ